MNATFQHDHASFSYLFLEDIQQHSLEKVLNMCDTCTVKGPCRVRSLPPESLLANLFSGAHSDHGRSKNLLVNGAYSSGQRGARDHHTHPPPPWIQSF